MTSQNWEISGGINGIIDTFNKRTMQKNKKKNESCTSVNKLDIIKIYAIQAKEKIIYLVKTFRKIVKVKMFNVFFTRLYIIFQRNIHRKIHKVCARTRIYKA